MIRQHWESVVAKVDGMSLRERVLIFAAAAFILVSAISTFSLDPLLAQQKKSAAEVIQNQEKMKEIQGQRLALLQAQKEDASSPLRDRIKAIKQQIAEGDTYLKNLKLVPPEKMAGLLEQMLSKNAHLQLVGLETLAAVSFTDASVAKAEVGAVAKPAPQDMQIYKHGVKITVRGSYADLLQYLTELEKMPTQMFWGSAKMSVAQYPTAELTLTLYTLSLGSVWLQV